MSRDAEPRAHGHSGDFGWNDAGEVGGRGFQSVLFVAATTAYFASIWLLGGLAPLPALAMRFGAHRNSADLQPTHTTNWRNTPE